MTGNTTSGRSGKMNESVRINIIEDDLQAEKLLREYIERYGKENNRSFVIKSYNDGRKFLETYDFSCDIVLMDIDLPGENGMDIVRKLRTKDQNVVVMFVTNLAHYAVDGYAVDAFEFIVKPVTYYNFAMKLKRGIVRLESRKDARIEIGLKGGGSKFIRVSDIKYVEVMNHTLCYHTVGGDYAANGSMTQICEQLKDYSFALCNRCYLVNFRYVEGVDQYEVTVGGEQLQISHLKRKAFMHKMNLYFSGEQFADD